MSATVDIKEIEALEDVHDEHIVEPPQLKERLDIEESQESSALIKSGD